MTAHTTSDSVPSRESSGSLRPLRLLALVVAPLGMAGVMWFHPHGGEDMFASLLPVAERWFLVHVFMLPAIGLLGAALYVLLDGYDGVVATVGRIATLVYVVAYVGFEALAGIATGLQLRAAQSLDPAHHEGAEAMTLAVGESPLTIGLALLGTVACFVATGAIVTAHRRDDAPALPLACLFGAPLLLVAHGTRWAPLFAGLFLVGGLWLELGWRRSGA